MGTGDGTGESQGGFSVSGWAVGYLLAPLGPAGLAAGEAAMVEDVMGLMAAQR